MTSYKAVASLPSLTQEGNCSVKNGESGFSSMLFHINDLYSYSF